VRKLNPKQERFCQLYTSGGEFFGNGVQAYIEAYKPKQTAKNWYKSAQGSASRLLSNAIICGRINELLSADGFNNQFMDKQVLFLATQFSDFNAKIRAIQEYNKLKKRITEKLDVNLKVRRLVFIDNKDKKQNGK
jgi:hypothetical protein